jgi:predicted transcriptional regulator
MVSPKMKEVRMTLVPERHKRLKQLARAEGSSIAVIIRRAINEFLDRNATKDGE